MKPWRASCSCGQVTATCQTDPTLVSLCNCQECQRRTGSAFGIAAFFGRDDVTMTGNTVCYTRSSDSGFAISFHFCPTCGTTVYWFPERKPDMIAVAAGCFADPQFPPPRQSVYEDHKRAWLSFDFDDQD